MEKLNCTINEITDSIEDLISEGAVIPVYVSGSSMNPFLISRRDIVYLESVGENDVKAGRILLVRRKSGSLVLHRVRKINSDGTIVLNGDAQSWCETAERNQVIAAVCEIDRKGKKRSADSFYWKSINMVWKLLFPFRSIIMRVWNKIKRMKSNR